jgi:hypothetical protein
LGISSKQGATLLCALRSNGQPASMLSLYCIHRLERQRVGPVQYPPKKGALGSLLSRPVFGLVSVLLLAGTACVIAGMIVDR